MSDDDFHPATAGDDPIWLGGVEYITRKRSDELVAAERERCINLAATWSKDAATIREGGE